MQVYAPIHERAITLSSSSNIIGHEPFKKRILASVKRHGPHFDEKYLWDSLRPIIPYPTGRFFEGHFARHFVPGYDRCCPYGTRWQTFRNSSS